MEKLNTCTVRPGSAEPRLTGGADAMSPAWSSSTTSTSGCLRSTAASWRTRAGVMLTPVGLCALGCTNSATGRWVERVAASASGGYGPDVV